MTGKEFLKKIANGKDDLLQSFIDILSIRKIKFCIIGGLAVNAYAEPVVSLDLDVVIVSEKLDSLLPVLKKKYKIESFPNSINLFSKKSDLRIQIQIDHRYQDFLSRARKRDVLGYKITVAAVEDVLQGKIWAATDETRRPSKRQKDLADILRLIEANSALANRLPAALKTQLKFS